MRRLLRPWPLLFAAYLAATVGLALLLPPRPSVEFVDQGTRLPFLVGFSPDGRRLATAPAPVLLTKSPYELQTAPIRVRDLTRSFGQTPFTQLADTEANYRFAIRRDANAAFWRHLDDPTFAPRLAEIGLATPGLPTPRWEALSPDGRYCAGPLSIADDNVAAEADIGVWDMETGQRRLAVDGQVAIEPRLRDAAFTSDGAMFTTLLHTLGGRVRFQAWDVAAGRLAWESRWQGLARRDDKNYRRFFEPDRPPSTKLSPDGRRLVEHDEVAGRWYLRDTVSGEARPLIDGPSGECLFVRGGRDLAVLHNDSSRETPASLRIVDLETNREVFLDPQAIAPAELGHLHAVSPDGSMLVVSVRDRLDHETLLIDAVDGKALARLPGGCMQSGPNRDEYAGMCVAFSANGRRLAVVEDVERYRSTIRVWDLPIGRPWAFAARVAAVPALALAGMIGAWRFARRRTTRR